MSGWLCWGPSRERGEDPRAMTAHVPRSALPVLVMRILRQDLEPGSQAPGPRRPHPAPQRQQLRALGLCSGWVGLAESPGQDSFWD